LLKKSRALPTIDLETYLKVPKGRRFYNLLEKKKTLIVKKSNSLLIVVKKLMKITFQDREKIVVELLIIAE